MVFSMFHLITYLLLLSVPLAFSITFNLTNINPRHQNRDIVMEGMGANISNGGIQLTTNGQATYFRSLHLWDRRTQELASFSTSFTFVILTNGSNSYGDGLTFFLAQSSSVTQGGYMGLPFNTRPDFENSPFVAVEFDTMDDHVGINVHSVSSAKSQNWFSNVTGSGVCQAWITYDSVMKDLTVSIAGFKNSTVVPQEGLVHKVDLKKELPEWVNFGFSAPFGVMFQRYTVRSWSFESSDLLVDKNKEWPPVPSPNRVKGKLSKMSSIVGFTVMISFLVVLAFVFWMKKKSRVIVSKEITFSVEMNNEFERGLGPKQFSYLELVQSTSDFSENNKLGDGDFGRVYKGFLKDTNKYIAVKRVSKSYEQGIEEYASEVRIISQLRHKNLVQLIGWCHEKGELLLVYNYMENGSLDSHLFKGKSLLAWGTRYKIANGLASALWYLHDGWEQCVLHRDVKSGNIMLDSNFNAKLGDFGLAKLVDREKVLETITSDATVIDCIVSECVIAGKTPKESDVHSYGVVALEIACGQKLINNKAQEKLTQFIEWLWELYMTDTLIEAIDPHLGSDFEEEEIKRLMTVGLWCVHPRSELRPSMRQVIQVLNFEASLPVLHSTMPMASHISSGYACFNYQQAFNQYPL
ncbi:putative protein kinase RLK-Pelle-L-LEC family [Helianthus annuus]|uniref:Putative serine/threonine/dual specificity protein kinase, catalytic domain-containing protein n=1 Tax=Helianthus annuus TaxID=4232 RepID=A0A251RUT3_HELAN|nr:L-type lectin-domain containing receptor kinase IX.1 [Helianthus annuus]KAF5788904.1 putative protein kinase RLK-Pelle-L-LEC family [Helianthus annuus]KAJ0540705.1 putative protein kinase RLK-Pelle-L-LEC family [Helianthus annuus]KAJ0886158.1 putative protein kinase RLK-Pelle-L-LEC family [Helianthus annuus]